MVIDELLCRFLGSFKKGITFTKVDGGVETGLDQKRIVYNILTGMWFGKRMVACNILRFWKESLQRLTSLMIARKDDVALAKNNALLLQAIKLFCKLLDNSKSDSDGEIIVEDECHQTEAAAATIESFQCNVDRVFQLTQQCSENKMALQRLLVHWKNTYASDDDVENDDCDVIEVEKPEKNASTLEI